jgi:predicted PurR-regulated permease PerM
VTTHSNTRSARATLTVLTVLGIVLLALIVYPFAAALFLGAVLASAFQPLCDRLARAIGGRREWAAAVITIAVVLLLVIPLASLAITLGGEVVDGVASVRSILQSEGMAGLISRMPAPLQDLALKVIERVPRAEQQLQQWAGSQGGRAAAAMGGVLMATGGALAQTAMMLIAFYFMLVDGHRLVDWLSDVAPLPPGETRELLGEFRRVSVAVLISSVATAGIQALVALLGYLLAGVPQPFFFTAVTFIMAFIPAVGAGSVAVALALLVWATGHAGAALFLVLWGVLVVGLSDNLIKPLLMRGRMEIHGGVIFFALLGGLAVFGMVGLVAGPLVVAFFLSVVRMWRDHDVYAAGTRTLQHEGAAEAPAVRRDDGGATSPD